MVSRVERGTEKSPLSTSQTWKSCASFNIQSLYILYQSPHHEVTHQDTCAEFLEYEGTLPLALAESSVQLAQEASGTQRDVMRENSPGPHLYLHHHWNRTGTCVCAHVHVLCTCTCTHVCMYAWVRMYMYTVHVQNTWFMLHIYTLHIIIHAYVHKHY